MSHQLKNNALEEVKKRRRIIRNELFNTIRNGTRRELDYLQFYSAEIKQKILESMVGPEPQILPPPSTESISFYKRREKPVFLTRNSDQETLDYHMTYQSLWMFACAESKDIHEYEAIVKEFEKNLHLYMMANSQDIKQIAIIAAGNKILGREEDILSIVEKDEKQLWVLINHVYQSKIHLKHLFKYLNPTNKIVYRAIYEKTNYEQDQSIQTIINDEEIMKKILDGLECQDVEILQSCIRISGNILAEKMDYIYIMQNYKILKYLPFLLSHSNSEIRQDACWMLTNYASDKSTATQIMRNEPVMGKLMKLFGNEQNVKIKEEVTYIFTEIVKDGEKIEVFQLMANDQFLEHIYQHLEVNQTQLAKITLLLLRNLIDLGEYYPNENDQNIILLRISQISELKNLLSKKAYQNTQEISSMCTQIIDLIQELEDNQ